MIDLHLRDSVAKDTLRDAQAEKRGTMPNHPETEQLVRGYVDAIASRVHEDVFAFYDDDIVYEDTAVRQIYRGLEATKGFYKKSMTALAVSWSVDTIVCHESGFGLAWVMTGRHELDLPGMPATGRKFEVPGASIAEVRGGKIVHNRDFWNNLDLLTQLGYRLAKPS
jgi:steroid delta-isomerase-like uncharacterized protein